MVEWTCSSVVRRFHKYLLFCLFFLKWNSGRNLKLCHSKGHVLPYLIPGLGENLSIYLSTTLSRNLSVFSDQRNLPTDYNKCTLTPEVRYLFLTFIRNHLFLWQGLPLQKKKKKSDLKLIEIHQNSPASTV